MTIAALNPGGARFDDLDLRFATNLRLDGLTVDGTLKVWYGSENIRITNSKADYLWLRDSSAITVEGNEFGTDRMALLVRTAPM